MTKRRSTGNPRAGSWPRLVGGAELPPDPPSPPDDGDDEHDHDWRERVIQILPADGWRARYERGVGRVVCWAIVEETCPGCERSRQDVHGMVVMPGWSGIPAPYWVFIGHDTEKHEYGDFLGFEPPEGW